jgi:hypothetical protein
MNGPYVSVENTPNILSCNEMRYFWIRFLTDTLEVGASHMIGFNPILIYMDESARSIQSVTISTGEGQKGVWGFDMFDSKCRLLGATKLFDIMAVNM